MLCGRLPNSHPSYFFWSGNGDPRSAAKAFQRSYWKLFKLAKIQKPDGTPKRCHPHMFRDTFAVELLFAGVPLDQVSLLLGHSSVKITERHYAPFCKARQEQLAASVKLAWKKPTQSLQKKQSFILEKACKTAGFRWRQEISVTSWSALRQIYTVARACNVTNLFVIPFGRSSAA